ncbi:MAG: hypothetical protein KDE47_19845, partial [Caldilineaceae bacterium]|nr:hypothetical protein [Caldilineaceae bacterium]
MTHPYDKNQIDQAERELAAAYDYDRQDPLFGLRREELAGPKLGRRTVLRLLAAAGALSLTDILTACAPAVAPAGESSTQAGTKEEAAASSGGEMTCGWGGTAEITTLDPAQINQV